MNVKFYIENCYQISKLVTNNYSTSFSLAISLLEEDKRLAIYAIYGFVRLADEIVDSMEGYDKSYLLEKLNDDLQYAFETGMSTNTILVSFVDTVNRYNINRESVDAFMDSMKYDLTKLEYTNEVDLDKYIYGSADVVGLMCLKVFCNGNSSLYEKLECPARKLGSAFQKVNFLRDLKDDINNLGRSYFPEVSKSKFDDKSKKQIEESIKKDFDEAWKGVKQLPGRSKLAVALAYYYYNGLFKKIMRTPSENVLKKRVRISNLKKYLIIIKAAILYKIKFI